MKRINVFWYALESVFLVVFLVFFFTLSKAPHHASVWVAFCAIILSYLSVVLTPFMVRKGAAEADYRRPLFVASTAYFLIAFVFNLIIILVNPEHAKLTVLVNIILFAAYAVFLLANLIANEHTGDQEDVRAAELKYVKEGASLLKSQLSRVHDRELSRKIQEAYDLVSTSPAKSSAGVRSLEDSILQEIVDLSEMDPSRDAIDMMKSAELIVSMAQKRNAKLQLDNRK